MCKIFHMSPQKKKISCRSNGVLSAERFFLVKGYLQRINVLTAKSEYFYLQHLNILTAKSEYFYLQRPNVTLNAINVYLFHNSNPKCYNASCCVVHNI